MIGLLLPLHLLLKGPAGGTPVDVVARQTFDTSHNTTQDFSLDIETEQTFSTDFNTTVEYE